MITGLHSGKMPPCASWRIRALAVLILTLGAWQCPAIDAEPDGQGNGGISFKDVTDEAGLGDFRHVTGAVGKYWMPETLGGGGGFVDYDGDGLLDVLLVRGAQWGDEQVEPVDALVLYRNQGDGTFSDHTLEAGLGGIVSYAFGVTVADYDNDGDDDFYLTTLDYNLLFRNDYGVFVEVAEEAGVAGPPEWSTASVFFDADLDGHVDLYVGNYVKWSPETDVPCSLAGGVRSYCTPDTYDGLGGRFYHNNGDGTFTEKSAAAGFAPSVPGKTLAAAHLDFDRDGWMDLIVVNDTERDLLYENKGDGTFEEIGVISGIAYDRNGKARAGMGIDVGVVDSTGRPTVFIANFAREQIGVYHYAGDGRFVDRAQPARIGQPSMNHLSFGVIVFDADLDGYVDVLTANGHINPEIGDVDAAVTYRQPARLYRNTGDGTFEVVESTGRSQVLDEKMVARGASYGDYDRDGDLDVLLAENGGPAHLWRNDVKGQGFLRVQLVGDLSNRSAIGARVQAVVGEHKMTQVVRTGSSYLSSFEHTLTFGLGEHSVVDSLTIYWPSGQVDTLVHVTGRQEIRVTEGKGTGSVWSRADEGMATGL